MTPEQAHQIIRDVLREIAPDCDPDTLPGDADLRDSLELDSLDFLDRFRPVGVPGSAARAGVPADRARELAAEVEPVLVLLDDTPAECDQIIAAARQEAAGSRRRRAPR